MLVVMVLIALVAGIAAPALARRFDTIALQAAATDLASQLKRAQAVARSNQIPVAMTYSDHTFRFWKTDKPIATYDLPRAISPVQRELPTYVFLPSGQIVGGDDLELQNERGRKIEIKMDLLSGIAVRLGAAM